jgi:hypothetical protein
MKTRRHYIQKTELFKYTAVRSSNPTNLPIANQMPNLIHVYTSSTNMRYRLMNTLSPGTMGTKGTCNSSTAHELT